MKKFVRKDRFAAWKTQLALFYARATRGHDGRDDLILSQGLLLVVNLPPDHTMICQTSVARRKWQIAKKEQKFDQLRNFHVRAN